MGKQKRNPADERNRARAASGRRRRRRRKRSYILYYIMLLLFVAVALITLSVTVLFNISSVSVEGNKAIKAAEIIKASQVQEGDNLFRLNLDDIESRVITAVRGVDAVTVKRKLPATLKITVNEVKPCLNIKNELGYAVLSENHRVIEIGRQTPDTNAITLTGVDIGEVSTGDFVDIDKIESYTTAEEIRAELKNSGIDGVVEIDVSNIVNISVNRKNKHRIDLGTVSELPYKLKFVKKVLDENLERGVINAKTPGRVYFKPDASLYGKPKENKEPKDDKAKKSENPPKQEANTSSDVKPDDSEQ